MEAFYPLRALVCGGASSSRSRRVETLEWILSEYAYFSSYSSSWLEHSRRYAVDVTDVVALAADGTTAAHESYAGVGVFPPNFAPSESTASEALADSGDRRRRQPSWSAAYESQASAEADGARAADLTASPPS